MAPANVLRWIFATCVGIGRFPWHEEHEYQCSDREKLIRKAAKNRGQIFPEQVGRQKRCRSDGAREILDLVAVCVNEENMSFVVYENVSRVYVAEKYISFMKFLNRFENGQGKCCEFVACPMGKCAL